MARKYKKVYGSRRPLKTVKYSNETSNITSSFSITQGGKPTNTNQKTGNKNVSTNTYTDQNAIALNDTGSASAGGGAYGLW